MGRVSRIQGSQRSNITHDLAHSFPPLTASLAGPGHRVRYGQQRFLMSPHVRITQPITAQFTNTLIENPIVQRDNRVISFENQQLGIKYCQVGNESTQTRLSLLPPRPGTSVVDCRARLKLGNPVEDLLTRRIAFVDKVDPALCRHHESAHDFSCHCEVARQQGDRRQDNPARLGLIHEHVRWHHSIMEMGTDRRFARSTPVRTGLRRGRRR